MVTKTFKEGVGPNGSKKEYHRSYGIAAERYGGTRPNAQYAGMALRSANGSGGFRTCGSGEECTEWNGSKWATYSNSKDEYKLHIERITEDKVISDDSVLAPCVASEWVYYIFPLENIYKIKLDGSQKTKVCNTDALVVYNPNVNKYHGLNGSTSVTAEYKDGYILYACYQMQQIGDKKMNPTSYYKLDPNTNKITEVKEK
jgi:hypothetical protein